MKRQQQLVECSYGEGGYACCEGGPCAADVHNDKVLQHSQTKTLLTTVVNIGQQRHKRLTMAAFDRLAHEADRENREKRSEVERIARNKY